MTIRFNAFTAPVSGIDPFGNPALIFPAIGQTGVEMRLRVDLGTTYDPATGTFSGGNFLGFELFDVTNNFFRQTADLNTDALGNPGSANGFLNTFLSQSLGVIADTFTAWDIIGGAGPLGVPAGIGAPHLAPNGSSLTFDLVDPLNTTTVVGQFKINGTNIRPNTPETASTITSIELLDSAGAPLSDTKDR